MSVRPAKTQISLGIRKDLSVRKLNVVTVNIHTTVEQELSTRDRASSSDVCEISKIQTRPSVDPVANLSASSGWKHTCGK